MGFFEKIFIKKTSSTEEPRTEEKPNVGSSFSSVKRNWDNPTEEEKELEKLHDDLRK